MKKGKKYIKYLIRESILLNEIGDFNNLEKLKLTINPQWGEGSFEYKDMKMDIEIQEILQKDRKLVSFSRKINNLEKRKYFNVFYDVNDNEFQHKVTDYKTLITILYNVSRIVKELVEYENKKSNKNYPVFLVYGAPISSEAPATDNSKKNRIYSLVLSKQLGSSYISCKSKFNQVEGFAFYKK